MRPDSCFRVPSTKGRLYQSDCVAQEEWMETCERDLQRLFLRLLLQNPRQVASQLPSNESLQERLRWLRQRDAHGLRVFLRRGKQFVSPTLNKNSSHDRNKICFKKRSFTQNRKITGFNLFIFDKTSPKNQIILSGKGINYTSSKTIQELKIIKNEMNREEK